MTVVKATPDTRKEQGRARADYSAACELRRAVSQAVGFSSATQDPCKHSEAGKYPGETEVETTQKKGHWGALGAHLPLTFLLTVLTAGTEGEQGEEPSNQD